MCARRVPGPCLNNRMDFSQSLARCKTPGLARAGGTNLPLPWAAGFSVRCCVSCITGLKQAAEAGAMVGLAGVAIILMAPAFLPHLSMSADHPLAVATGPFGRHGGLPGVRGGVISGGGGATHSKGRIGGGGPKVRWVTDGEASAGRTLPGKLERANTGVQDAGRRRGGGLWSGRPLVSARGAKGPEASSKTRSIFCGAAGAVRGESLLSPKRCSPGIHWAQAYG